MKTWRGFMLGMATAMCVQNLFAFAHGGSFKFTASALALSSWFALVLLWVVLIAYASSEGR